jgi:MFS family permease
MRLPAGLAALNHRDFRIFWVGQLVSLVGNWMQSVGQSWLVLDLTGSAFKLGLIGTLQFLPVLLFSLFAGAVIDRLPKRRVLLVTQSILMVLALLLAALVKSGHVQYWHIAVMAVVLGCVNTVDMPARQSYVVEMVGKEDLVNAIALNSAIFNGARMIGPAVAGALIAKYGVGTAYLLNGASFVAVISALLAVRAEGLPAPRKNTTVFEEVKEGLRFVWRTPVTFLMLSLLLVVSIFVLNWNVLVPLLAKQVLGLEAQGFGFLMSSLGAGALLGALVLAQLGRKRSLFPVVVGGAIAVAVTALAMGFVRAPLPAQVLLFVIGIAQILFTACCNTTVQVTTPDALRGRVMAIYSLVFAGVAPIGSMMTGTVTEAWGASVGFLFGGSMGLAAVLALLGWWALRRQRQAKAA